MSPDPTELNETTLGEMLRGLDKETLVELVDFYINETRGRVPGLRALLEENNFTDLKREAHSLKGASRTYGASGYGEIAYNLETASKDENVADAEKWLNQIETHMDVALSTLQARVQALPEG